MKMLSKKSHLNLLLLIALAILITSNLLAYQQIQRVLNANFWVTHTQQVINTTDELQVAFSEARLRTYQFIISNDKTYTQDLPALIAKINQNITTLKQLIIDNPIQQRTFNQLVPLVQSRLALFQHIAQQYSGKNQPQIFNLLLNPQQQLSRKQINLFLAAIINEEQNLLNFRSSAVIQAEQQGKFVFIIAATLAITFLILCIILLNYYLFQHDRSELIKKETEQRLQLMIEAAEDYAILMLSPEGIITSWNTGAQRIKGYTAKEIIGQHFSRFYPEEAIKKNHPAYELKIAKEKGRYEEEGWRVRKDGSLFWANVIITALRDHEGNLLGFGKITRDLTERKKNEKIKSEFISVVSHELRTPLTSIRGSLGLVLSGAVGTFSEKAQQLLNIADKNCSRLLLLINDILDIEKIEAGKVEFHLELLDINHVAQEAISANNMYAKQFGVTFKFISDVKNVMVNADSARLMQVLANLISNACKFSDRNSEVIIEIKQQGDRIRVSVTNKGPGIPKEFQHRIFERFAQADSSDTRSKGGTGLGLNISKSIVEKMGGKINFNSEPGHTTTFYVDLPVWSKTPTQINDINPAITFKNKILICEDDSDQAEYLSALLKSAGLDVDISQNVEEAKKLLQKNNYFALLLDLILPDQDGISFIRELRSKKETRTLPIIVVSIIAKTGRSILNGEAFSVIDWLDKPVNFNILLQSISQIKAQVHPKIPRILHVEDNVDTQQIISALLKDHAEVISVATLSDTRKKLAEDKLDLIILDLILPDGNGVELLPLFAKYKLPIIVYSAIALDSCYAKYVNQALIKSKTSPEELILTIKTFIEKN